MSRKLLEKFDNLMSHLNSEENNMAEKFRMDLEQYIVASDAYCDKLFALEAAGVDNWEGYGDAMCGG